MVPALCQGRAGLERERGQVVRPGLHQLPALVQQVRTEVGHFDSAARRVGPEKAR